jgi:hypothetical protein
MFFHISHLLTKISTVLFEQMTDSAHAKARSSRKAEAGFWFTR